MALVVSKGEKDHIVKYVHNRVLVNNKNFISIFTGPTGSGKTYTALKVAEEIDPDFDASNIAFTAKEFMDLINNKTKELKSGSVILWDEMQISMGHMDYQSFVSKAINYVLTTFRHRNIVLLVTAPYFGFINASSRKLFHAVFEIEKIDKKRKVTISKPLFIQINQRSGKEYYKFLRVARGDGTTPQIKRYACGLPSPELLKEYESRKKAFTDELNQNIMDEIEERSAKKEQKKEIKRKGRPLTGKQENVLNMLKDKKTPKQIMEETGIPLPNITVIMDSIRKRGITLLKHYNKSKNEHYYIINEPTET